MAVNLGEAGDNEDKRERAPSEARARAEKELLHLPAIADIAWRLCVNNVRRSSKQARVRGVKRPWTPDGVAQILETGLDVGTFGDAESLLTSGEICLVL